MRFGGRNEDSKFVGLVQFGSALLRGSFRGCRGELDHFAAGDGYDGPGFWPVVLRDVKLDDAGHGTTSYLSYEILPPFGFASYKIRFCNG